MPAPADAPASPDPAQILWTRSLRDNRGFAAAAIEGALPDDLRGTLYRNGPGLFGQFGRRYAHPFEADGAVTALRIDAGGAAAASHIHDSTGLEAERAAGRQLFGFNVSLGRRFLNLVRGRDKNTANTNVMWWNGRLFALMEAAPPTELDPRTLATLGETDLDGVVTGAFSAHPHRSARRATTYNFGVSYGRKSRIDVYALPDAGGARRLTSIDLGSGPMLHDFIASDDHLIFFVSPTRISVPHLMLGRGIQDMFQWRPEAGTEVIVVPIDDPHAVVRFHTDAFYQWHFTNAVSRAGEIQVEYVRYPDFSSFYALAQPDLGGTGEHGPLAQARYHRATIDLRARTLRSELLLDEACEFPRVHPAVEGGAHRHVWMTLGDLDGLGRLDAHTGALAQHRVPSHQRVSEPIFVPRAGAAPGDEADGHVLSLCYDARRDESFVAIYDGRRLADGPVARAWLGYPVPITFHGTWVPAAAA